MEVTTESTITIVLSHEELEMLDHTLRCGDWFRCDTQKETEVFTAALLSKLRIAY